MAQTVLIRVPLTEAEWVEARKAALDLKQPVGALVAALIRTHLLSAAKASA